MAQRRRQPLAVEVAEGITSVWGLAFAFLVVVPRVSGSTTPLAPNVAVLLALGGVLMLGSWVWVVRTLRAQLARGESLARLQAMTPTAFEQWVGARFRELGYTVEVTGAQGDHGIDLSAKRAGETAVVQVKKFVTTAVGEPLLRDLYGAMHATGANRAYLVTTGRLTDAARAWAAGKPIELWDADAVTRLSLKPTATSPSAPTPVLQDEDASAARCPRCEGELVKRRNRRTGERFHGCSRYPSCRYTQPGSSPPAP